jgi:hypothetical protein
MKEFASIRHGNYFNFLNLVKGEIPFKVVYNSGIIILQIPRQQKMLVKPPCQL